MMPDDDWATGLTDDSTAAGTTVPQPQPQPQPWEDGRVGMPLLARGVRWSDIVAEMQRDNELRDAA